MAKGRTIKFPPKRGKLTRSQAKRAVEKVLYGKEGSRKAASSNKRNHIMGCDYYLFLRQSKIIGPIQNALWVSHPVGRFIIIRLWIEKYENL